MPTYIFKNTKTDEVFEKQMRISELDQFKKENLILFRCLQLHHLDLKEQDGMKQTLKQEIKNIAKSDNETQSSPKPKEKKDSSTKKVSSEKK